MIYLKKLNNSLHLKLKCIKNVLIDVNGIEWHIKCIKSSVMLLMSIEELAEYLCESERTIYRYIQTADCPPYIRLTKKNIKFNISPYKVSFLLPVQKKSCLQFYKYYISIES